MNKLSVKYHFESAPGVPPCNPSVKSTVFVPFDESQEHLVVDYIRRDALRPVGSFIVVHESHDPRREYIEHERTCGYCRQTRIEKEKRGVLFDKGPSTWRRYLVTENGVTLVENKDV